MKRPVSTYIISNIVQWNEPRLFKSVKRKKIRVLEKIVYTYILNCRDPDILSNY